MAANSSTDSSFPHAFQSSLQLCSFWCCQWCCLERWQEYLYLLPFEVYASVIQAVFFGTTNHDWRMKILWYTLLVCAERVHLILRSVIWLLKFDQLNGLHQCSGRILNMNHLMFFETNTETMTTMLTIATVWIILQWSQALAQMCEECDVEMFMVMPRHLFSLFGPLNPLNAIFNLIQAGMAEIFGQAWILAVFLLSHAILCNLTTISTPPTLTPDTLPTINNM